MDKSLIIAIYGAIISTILAIREIVLLVNEFVREKRRLRVTVTCGAIEKSKKRGKKEIYSYTKINATNIGQRPVVILEAGFFFTNSSSTSFGVSPVNFPLKLNDGDTHTIDFECKDIQENIDNGYLTKAYVLDSDGRYYTSKISKNVREFIHHQSYSK